MAGELTEAFAGTLLLVPNYSESLRSTLAPLAAGARARNIKPVFVLRDGDTNSLSAANELNLDVEVVSLPPPNETSANVHVLDFTGAFRWLFQFRKRIKEGRRVADGLFEKHQPSGVICVSEAPELEALLLRKARSNNIPGLLVQWAHTPHREFIDEVHANQYSTALSQNRRRFASVYLIRRKLAGTALSLWARLNGSRIPRFLGDGDSTRFAVINENYAAMFRHQGIRESKIIVTGHPEDDGLFSYKSWLSESSSERNQLRTELGIGKDEKLIVYAREAIHHFDLIPVDTDQSIIRQVLKALSATSTARIVFRPHPRDPVSLYEWIRDEFPSVIVDGPTDLKSLIAASDLYLSQGSSTTRWAWLLGIPIVLIGFAQLSSTRSMANMISVEPVLDSGQLNDRVDELLHRSSHEMGDVQNGTQLDGAACGRILDAALDR